MKKHYISIEDKVFRVSQVELDNIKKLANDYQNLQTLHGSFDLSQAYNNELQRIIDTMQPVLFIKDGFLFI